MGSPAARAPRDKNSRGVSAATGLRLRQALVCALLLALRASAAVPAPPEPAPPASPIRVQILQSSREAPFELALAGFRRGLADALGPEGTAFELAIHPMAPGDEGKGAGAVRGQEKAALLFSMGTSATKLARKIAGERPTVFSMVVNPVAQGIYEPGGRDPITGVSMDVSFGEQFDALKRVLPRAKKVGVVHQSSNTGLVQRARDTARSKGMELVGAPIETSEQIPGALDELTGKVDALWSFADSVAYSPNLAQFIILHTLRNRLPFMGVSVGYVKAGALFCVYADYEDVGRQSAAMAAEILSGKSASGIPMQFPRHSKMALNLSAAEAIGLDIPLAVRKNAAERF